MNSDLVKLKSQTNPIHQEVDIGGIFNAFSLKNEGNDGKMLTTINVDISTKMHFFHFVSYNRR